MHDIPWFRMRSANHLSSCSKTRVVMVVVLACLAGIRAFGSNQQARNWHRQRVRYTYSSHQSQWNYIPPRGSPARAAYDAFAATERKDTDALVAVLAPESRQYAASFERNWLPRIERWKFAFMQTGVLEADGLGYVVISSSRHVPGNRSDTPFTSVLFMERHDDKWLLTHRVLDRVERDNVTRRFNALRRSTSKEAIEERLERSRREWFAFTARPMGVSPEDWDADAAYAKHKQTEAYLNRRQKEGSLATSFFEMMELYGGEYVSPPVTFSITDEPENPNFDNLLDAFQTAIYLRLLEVHSFPRTWEWSARTVDDAKASNRLPANIPIFSYVTHVSVTKLTRVQIMCRIPLRYNGNEYQKIHYRLVFSDDEKTMRLNDYIPANERIAFGYAYFKREGRRWIPNKDLDGYAGFNRVYTSFESIDQSLAFLMPNQAMAKMVDDVKGYFQDSPLPAHMRRFYTKEECIDIEDARKAGMWNNL